MTGIWVNVLIEGCFPGIILFGNPLVVQQPPDCNNPLQLLVLVGLSLGEVPDLTALM